MTRSCLIFACGDPVAARGRCARHGRQVDTSRSVGTDRQVGAALYSSRQWRELRGLVLALNPYCQCPDCIAGWRRWPSRVVHHREPHGGDPVRFFDEANLLALSKKCHNALTATSRLGECQSLQKIGAVLPRLGLPRVAGGSVQGPGVGKGAARG